MKKILLVLVFLVISVGALSGILISLQNVEQKNQISFASSVEDVKITGYVDFYEKAYELDEIIEGAAWELKEEDVDIDLTGVTEDTLPYSYRLLRIVVENNSSEGVGAYFYKAGSVLGSSAELENILLSSKIKNSSGNVVANVKYSSYTYIAAGESVNMFVMIKPELTYNNKAFNATLRVEPYTANVTESTMADAVDFVKLPVELTGGDMEHSVGGKIVCVPSTDYCTVRLTGDVQGVNSEFTVVPSMYAGGVAIDDTTNFESLTYYFDSNNGSVNIPNIPFDFKVDNGNGTILDDWSNTYFSNTPTEVGVYYGGFWILGEGITFTFIFDAGVCPDAIKAIAGSSCASLPTSIVGGDYVTTHNVKWIIQSTGEEVTSIAVKETTEIYIAVKTAV